jgi:hypothetical protein
MSIPKTTRQHHEVLLNKNSLLADVLLNGEAFAVVTHLARCEENPIPSSNPSSPILSAGSLSGFMIMTGIT